VPTPAPHVPTPQKTTPAVQVQVPTQIVQVSEPDISNLPQLEDNSNPTLPDSPILLSTTKLLPSNSATVVPVPQLPVYLLQAISEIRYYR